MSKPINRVIILHGYAVRPDKMWFPWLHAELEKLGIAVTMPMLPEPLRPKFRDWLKAAEPLVRASDDRTVVVAHSLGGVLALRALERFTRKPVRAVILVSAPFSSIISVKQLMEFFDRPIDWLRLRQASREYVVMHAKNDPLIPHDHALRHAEALSATLVSFAAGGHLNMKKFPRLLKEIKRFL